MVSTFGAKPKGWGFDSLHWHIIIWLLNATLYYILYTVESVWWGSLPLSSVYFVFPRNTSLSNCVLYERLKKCGWLGGLNPSCLNVDDGQLMMCDITLYCTSGDGVVGSIPDATLGDLGSNPSHTFSVQLWHIIIWSLNAILDYILYTVESVWWGLPSLFPLYIPCSQGILA